MDDKSIVRYVIGSTRVKYSILDDLFAPVKKKTFDSNMAVMLIDGNAIMSRLYRKTNFNLYTQSVDEMASDLVINFFNVIGHYRRYIARYLHLNNDIFVSFNMFGSNFHEELFPKFNEKLRYRYSPENEEYKFVNEVVSRAWLFILSLTPYFDGIYCIDIPGVDVFTSLAACSRFMKLGPNVLKIIMTRNQYALQLLRDDSTYILTEKRDDSYLIDRAHCYSWGLLKDSKSNWDEISVLTPELLPILWAFAGLKDCSVGPSPFTGANGPAGICRLAIKIIKDYGYDPATVSLKEFVRAMPEFCKYDYTDLQPKYPTLYRRYRVLNIKNSLAALTSDQQAKMGAQIYDLFNENELEEMNQILAEGRIDPDLFEIQNLNMSEAERYE